MIGKLIIVATAMRVRNGVSFAKGVEQTLKIEDFTKEQLEKFKNDPVLSVTYMLDDLDADQVIKAAQTTEQKEADAAKIAEINSKRKEDHAELKAMLIDLPDEAKLQDGNPSVTKLTKILKFRVTAETLALAQVEIATESAKNSDNSDD
ncbi:MAG: hypothetical protein HRU28_00015 [Rhizobiales bacterium]|nr:hypothetical protein [Hyphomicrobiales bacterium]